MIDDDKPWFAAKSHGYGAGLPIAWQGWVLIGLFLAGLLLAGLITMPHDPLAFVATTLVLSATLAFFASRKTRGGWRWRWGGKD